MQTVIVTNTSGKRFPLVVKKDPVSIKDIATILEASSEVKSWEFYACQLASSEYVEMNLSKHFKKYVELVSC